MTFPTYAEAYDYAVEHARDYGIDYGIARGNEYGKELWSVTMLPRPEKSFGFELRCERVTPESPIIKRSDTRPICEGR